MDNLSQRHVLNENVQKIGHGVKVLQQNQVNSKTLICFLATNDGTFHFGFSYKNGSNLRVVCWENDEMVRKTVHKGERVISFRDETTEKSLAGNWKAEDFEFAWFKANEKATIQKELNDLQDKEDRILTMADRLCQLSISNIEEIEKCIERKLNNPQED